VAAVILLVLRILRAQLQAPPGQDISSPTAQLFVTGTLRACLILNEPVEKPFSKINDIGEKRIATMVSVGFGWRFSNDGIGSSALPVWWHER
jgi:hypothetical protein